MEGLKKTELHVTVPKSRDRTKDSENDPSKEPVVMLFGWMGAQDKYLKVYSQIYEEQGFPTVRLTVSPLVVLFRHSEMSEYSQKLADLLEDPDFKGRPIIVHLFSNGGSFQYEVFSDFLDNTKRELIKGVILDSGPAKWTFYNSFSVCGHLLSSVISSKILVYPLTLLAMASSYSLLCVRKFQREVLKMPVYMMDPYNNLMSENNTCPQLFFYSKVDRLVPYKQLETFIEQRKARGVDVMYKLYENTPHVKHYASDKVGYCKTLFKFLNKALKR